MVRYAHGVADYAPLFIHRFRLLRPHFLADAERFNILYPDPSLLTSTADRLRFFRYKKGLLQRDVADGAGIERATYSAYEAEIRKYYPLDVMARIAALLDVDITDLLDEYNIFLYYGQARQIKEMRKRLRITQAALAARCGITASTVKRWELGRIRVTKIMWARICEIGEGARTVVTAQTPSL